MSVTGWIWRTALAVFGSTIGVVIGQEAIGGGALGWIVAGAIIAPSVMPLFQALFARRAELAAHREGDAGRRP